MPMGDVCPERNHRRSASPDACHDSVHLGLGIAEVSGQVEIHEDEHDLVASVLRQGEQHDLRTAERRSASSSRTGALGG